jgi:hypothetical protein
MDQLRTALVWLKKHHFWVLCGLVALVSLGSWAKASGKLSALFTTNQNAIKSEFTNVKGVRDNPFHPNEEVNSKQQEQTAKQAADVAKLWQELYERQRKNVLEWPPELSKDFRDFVDKLEFGAVIRPDLRNHYQNYIENHFPALPKQIEARAIDASVTAGAGPGGAEFGGGRFAAEGPGGTGTELLDDNNYICEWSPADQAIVRDDLNFREQPTSLRIWVTQENLWVYHTLLDVIAKTNRAANATRISNAAVQQIGELAVGPRAAAGSQTSGRLWVKPAEATASVGPGGPGEAGPGAAAGPEGGAGARLEFSPERMGPGSGPMTEEQEKSYLLSGRYLDAQGKPIPFGGGGAAPATGEEASPAPAADPAAAGQALDLTMFGQEYKRLPVRMSLRMDQRWLPRLISECASQPLQVEVQEVRINPPEGIGGAAGGPGMGRMGEGGPGGTASVFSEEPAVQPFPTQPEMVNVIIQGTIYIFNKPNQAILQTPGEQPAGEQPLAEQGPTTTAAAQ